MGTELYAAGLGDAFSERGRPSGDEWPLRLRSGQAKATVRT